MCVSNVYVSGPVWIQNIHVLSGFGATPKLPVVVQQWYASLPSTGRAYKIHYHRVRYWVVYGFPVYHYRMPSQSYKALEDVHASTHDGSRVTSMLMHEESGV